MSRKQAKNILANITNPSKLKEVITRVLNTRLGNKINQKKEELSKKMFKEHLCEDVYSNLEWIVKNHKFTNQYKTVRFDNGETMVVDTVTAQQIVKAHDSVNRSDLKQKIIKMVNSNPENFMKLLDIAIGK